MTLRWAMHLVFLECAKSRGRGRRVDCGLYLGLAGAFPAGSQERRALHPEVIRLTLALYRSCSAFAAVCG